MKLFQIPLIRLQRFGGRVGSGGREMGRERGVGQWVNIPCAGFLPCPPWPETARGPKQGPVTRRHRTYAVGLGVCVRGEGSVVLGALDRGELVVARTLLGRQRLPPFCERRLRLRRRCLGRCRPGRARSLLALRHVHEERVRTPRVRRRVRVLLRPPAVGALPRRRRQCRRPVAVLVRRARRRCLRRRRCSSRWACRSRLRWRAQQQSRVHLQAPRNPVRLSETQVTSLRPVLERWMPSQFTSV